ncbi:hypothetical protein SAVIM40S_03207 [Streptomyces avidinii]
MPLEGAQGPLDLQDAGQRGGPGHPHGHSVLLGRLPRPFPAGALGAGRPGGVEPDRVVGLRLRPCGLGGLGGRFGGRGVRAATARSLAARGGPDGPADVAGQPQRVGDLLGGRVESGGAQQGGQFTDAGCSGGCG